MSDTRVHLYRRESSVAIRLVMTSIAVSSRSADPRGGIWEDSRRDRIRTSIALVRGDASVIIPGASGSP